MNTQGLSDLMPKDSSEVEPAGREYACCPMARTEPTRITESFILVKNIRIGESLLIEGLTLICYNGVLELRVDALFPTSAA